MASSKYAVCTDLKAKTFQLTMLKLGANLLSQSSAWWYSGFFSCSPPPAPDGWLSAIVAFYAAEPNDKSLAQIQLSGTWLMDLPIDTAFTPARPIS